MVRLKNIQLNDQKMFSSGTGGKLAVVGSGAMFSDQFLDKEDNNKIKDVIFDFLTSDEFRLNEIDADDPEISDYNMVPVKYPDFLFLD